MGNNDLQALLGHGSRGFLLLAPGEVIEQAHGHPPNRRLSSPFFWASRKRWGTSLPSRRSTRSEEHTSELQSRPHLVCRLLLEKKKKHHNPKPWIPRTPARSYPSSALMCATH